jgi:hypothetical protein
MSSLTCDDTTMSSVSVAHDDNVTAAENTPAKNIFPDNFSGSFFSNFLILNFINIPYLTLTTKARNT